MLNDEQILLKTSNLLENFDISGQKAQKLLREITEEELEVLQDVLDDLKGENLAFNDLFDGKMRKVIDFPTMDTQSQLGQFVQELEQGLGVTVDWEKGLVSGEKEWREHSLENDVAQINHIMGQGPAVEKTKKKFQMKIGKYFAKLDNILKQYKESQMKVADNVYGDRKTSAAHTIGYSDNQIKDALSPEEQKRRNQILNQMELYFGGLGGHVSRYWSDYDKAQKGIHTTFPALGKYWQENAAYIKKEIKNLKNDKYSMIITRYPIDVLRMSDFNSWISCHSPPSREANYGSLYKCAVAEAMGHGALAYVVETDKLLEITDSETIEAAESKIQEGEIFGDEIRGSHIGLYHPKHHLSPISRVRLRQMRYYDTDEPKRWDEGTELAVPESRVYGSGIPGISERIRAWAKENQEKAIEKMPKRENDAEIINLDRFWIFGGSQEDTSGPLGRKTLLSRLTGVDEANLIGKVRQNTQTEDDIDVNLLGDAREVWIQEVDQIKDDWNNRYASTVVDGWVEDDGDGLYISAQWSVVLDWDYDEFIKLPNSYPASMHAAMQINSLYGDIFKEDMAFLNKTSYDGKEWLRWGCRVNISHPDVIAEEYFYDPDGLNEACSVIDTTIDDKRDAFRAALEEYFKQEGWMEGGEYIKLAYEIEDGPFESYEWDVRYDKEHPTESYEATAAVSHDFNAQKLELNPKVLFDILDSRDWRLAIRTALLDSAQKALGTEYHLDIENSKAVDSGEDIEYTLTFRITSDDPDERVKLFRELTTGEDSDMDDEDNIKAAFNNVMAQFINSRQPSYTQQNLDERLVGTWKQFIGR